MLPSLLACAAACAAVLHALATVRAAAIRARIERAGRGR